MKLRLWLFISTIIVQAHLTLPNENNITKISLEIVAALSDDIAELIITNKATTNAQQTKIHCINIIKHMTEIIAIIITKLQEKKRTRSITIFNPEEEQQIIEHIVRQLLLNLD